MRCLVCAVGWTRRDTGAVRWMEIQGSVLCDTPGIPAKTAGVLLDITDRKSAQEALRSTGQEPRGELAGRRSSGVRENPRYIIDSGDPRPMASDSARPSLSCGDLRRGHTVYVAEFGDDLRSLRGAPVAPGVSEPEIVQQLAGKVESLSAEVDDLRQRVRALEAGTSPASAATPQPSGARFGLTAVNRIGAVTLAIGVIFFFKYAVDSEWIGPRARIVLGLFAGLALIAAAEALRRRGQNVFSQGIAGCGLATLYITCYAAFAWYRWFSWLPAAAALIAVSALAVALSLRYAHSAIAALGFTGAVLTPILLRQNDSGATATLLYLLLLDVTCTWLAITSKEQASSRDWRVLAALTGSEVIVAGFFLTPRERPGWFVLFALALATERFLAGAATSAKRTLRDAMYITGHCFAVLGVLREIVLWTERAFAGPARNGAQSEFGSLFLALYGISALAIGIARRSPPARGFGLALIAAVIIKLYLWDVWFLQRLYRMSAFGMLGILLLAASWIYSRAKDAG